MSVFDHCGLFLALNRHVEHSVGQGANSAGQAGHVEHSVGQGADSAGQAGHVEHSNGQGADSAGQAGHVEHSVGQGADSDGQAGHVEHRTVALKGLLSFYSWPYISNRTGSLRLSLAYE